MSDNKLEENNDNQYYIGHRDRLRQRFVKSGAESLEDYELLELALFPFIPRKDVKPLAKQLIALFGGIAEVTSAKVADLERVKGISYNTAVGLTGISAFNQRCLLRKIESKPVLKNWDSLIDYCHASMAHEKVEQFRVLYLNRKSVIIKDEVMQRGTVDHTPVYPREILKRTLELDATALILVHNHPSGDPLPSDSDISMTEEIIKALDTIGVTIHDHIIISNTGNYSFKSMGLI